MIYRDRERAKAGAPGNGREFINLESRKAIEAPIRALSVQRSLCGILAMVAGVVIGVVLTLVMVHKLKPTQVDLAPELERQKQALTASAVEFSNLKGRYDSLVESNGSLESKFQDLKREHDKWKEEATKLGEQLKSEERAHAETEKYKIKWEDCVEEIQKWKDEATKQNRSWNLSLNI